MSSLRTSGAALVAALMTAGGLAGVAQARTENVVPAIHHEARTLSRAGRSENIKHLKIRTSAQARRDEPKFRALADTLDRAATVVAHSTVDSATQRRGRHDWVTGVRGVARGFRQIDVVLKDLVDHDRAAARREATREDTTLLRASRKILAADRLLKLRAS